MVGATEVVVMAQAEVVLGTTVVVAQAVVGKVVAVSELEVEGV